MNPLHQKIVTKLAKEQEKKIEVQLEKVELAMKPEALLRYAEKIDDDLRKIEQKIEKSFLQYKEAHQQFEANLDKIANKIIGGNSELGEIARKLDDLGVRRDSSPELVRAGDLLGKLTRVATNMKGLYQAPK